MLFFTSLPPLCFFSPFTTPTNPAPFFPPSPLPLPTTPPSPGKRALLYFSTPEHAQDAPSCEEMSGVYHPLPSSSPGAPCLLAQKLRRGTRQTCTTPTHSERLPLLHANTTKEISLVRKEYGIDFFFLPPPPFSLVMVLPAWHSTARLTLVKPQQRHPGLSRLHFRGSGETRGVKRSSLVPLPHSVPTRPLSPLFPPLVYSSDP